MRSLLALNLLLPAAVFAAPGNIRTNAVLVWSYPTNELSTNLTFIIYSSTNLSTPLTNWPVLKVVAGTNLQTSFPISQQQRWFVMTSSNWWGASDFSEVAATPPLPRSDVKLELGE